jgi:hypothetical protein
MEKVEKKAREARFFLTKMSEQERLAFGDKEPFDFFLSAFLSATRTIDNRLRHEQCEKYLDWRKVWDEKLTRPEKSIIKFMIDDRNIEVHEGGSRRNPTTGDINVGNFYSDQSGSLFISGPPSMSGATIQRPAYSFTIAELERKVTTVCAEYLALLERMVEEFKIDVTKACPLKS